MEYSTMKVPELKKLLQERGLPINGNKPDLIARLKEDDSKKEPSAPAAADDEIDYSEDDIAKPTTAPAQAEPPAEPTKQSEPEPAAAPADAAPASDDPPAAAEGKNEETAANTYALNLAATDIEAEAKKREERAKRFGIQEDDEAKKRLERAKKFGVDNSSIAKGLDSALPERPLKRTRGKGDEGEGGGKRQSMERGDHRRGGQGRGGRRGRFNGRRGGGVGGGGAKSGGSILDDPKEREKAEKRAQRFAAS